MGAVAVTPIHHLAHPFGVADSEVLFRPDGKHRLEYPGHSGPVWRLRSHATKWLRAAGKFRARIRSKSRNPGASHENIAIFT
jgi:hypothetical protein